MTVSITFLGAVGTVTGSKYLVSAGDRKILVDCGLFQGFKQLRLRNWSPLPIAPQSIDAALLTHAHLDHSGYLPRLVKDGYSGPVFCTSATRDLCGILLPDSGHLQERDAEYANRFRYSKHNPALPLYTQKEAERSLNQLETMDFGATFPLAGAFEARFHYAGHILGAAMIELHTGGKTILFSGDLGRPNDPMLPDPERIEGADYLVVESTYGDRKHDPHDPQEALAGAIARTAARGGTVLIPAFAVGRAQTILFHLHRLREANRIPQIPIFLDSPMAIDATDIFCAHPKDHRMTTAEARAAFGVAQCTRTGEESKALSSNTFPKIIISASGMATGGRILHHLESYASDPRNLILFTGFQASGTRGAALVSGAKTIKMYGDYVDVRAEVVDLHMLSAHADAPEILSWLHNFKYPPKATFITHGEPAQSDSLRRRIEEELGWHCIVPEYRDESILS